MVSDRFDDTNYVIRKKVLHLVGHVFHVYGSGGAVLFYAKQKAFKLKEDIRLYTGEDMQTEALYIQARQILDFSAAYDVYDSTTGRKVGALQRRGLQSIIQDEWAILDENDQPLGTLREESTILALVRRFVSNLIPQTYDVEVNGQRVCVMKRNFNPLVSKVQVDFSGDKGGVLDKRLGIAAGVLLCAIEGKQSSY